MADRLSLRDRIGGPQAFSLRVWLILTIAAVPFMLLIDQHGIFTRTSLRDALVATIAVGIVTGAAFLAVARLRRPQQSLTVAAAVAIALGIAVLRAVAGPLVLDALGEDVSVASRLLATSLPIALLLLTINAGLASLVVLREQRSALLTTLVELRGRQLQQQALREAITNALLTNVLTATDDLRRRVTDSVPADSAAERLEVADALRGTAMGSLRDLSHQLHAPAPVPDERRSGFLRVFLGTLATNPLWPRQTAVVSAAISTFGVALVTEQSAGTIGVAETIGVAFVSVALQFAFVWASLRGIVALGSRWRLPGVVALVLAIVATTAVSTAKTLVLLDLLGNSSSASLVATSTFVAILVVLGTTVAMATQQSQAAMIESLRTTVAESEADAIARNHELVRSSRILARYVHGTLQSRLLAAALAIEQAERDDDPAGYEMALEQARAALSLPDAFTTRGDDLATALAQTVELWQGFAAITVDRSSALPEPDAERVQDVCRVVEEALANAMRHGNATTIGITVHAADGALEVAVTDDGSGPGHGRPGLGSTLFDLTGPWTLVPRAGTPGAVLTVRLAERAPQLAPQPA